MNNQVSFIFILINLLSHPYTWNKSTCYYAIHSILCIVIVRRTLHGFENVNRSVTLKRNRRTDIKNSNKNEKKMWKIVDIIFSSTFLFKHSIILNMSKFNDWVLFFIYFREVSPMPNHNQVFHWKKSNH